MYFISRMAGQDEPRRFLAGQQAIRTTFIKAPAVEVAAIVKEELIMAYTPTPRKQLPQQLREVKEMNIAIWQDGYDWLENHGQVGQAYLRQTVAAVEHGYTPDEIYHQIIREAGLHRIEIAERCRAAANFLLSSED